MTTSSQNNPNVPTATVLVVMLVVVAVLSLIGWKMVASSAFRKSDSQVTLDTTKVGSPSAAPRAPLSR